MYKIMFNTAIYTEIFNYLVFHLILKLKIIPMILISPRTQVGKPLKNELR